MQTSRLIRRKYYGRQQVNRFLGLAAKTTAASLLLFAWHIDEDLIFTAAIVSFFLSLLLTNHLNIRNFLPGINSLKPVNRITAIIFYILLILAIITCAA